MRRPQEAYIDLILPDPEWEHDQEAEAEREDEVLPPGCGSNTYGFELCPECGSPDLGHATSIRAMIDQEPDGPHDILVCSVCEWSGRREETI